MTKMTGKLPLQPYIQRDIDLFANKKQDEQENQKILRRRRKKELRRTKKTKETQDK